MKPADARGSRNRLFRTIIFAAIGVGLLLSVLGLGGFKAIIANPALTALAAVFIVLVGFSIAAGGNISSGTREDRGNRWVLVAFFAIMVFNSFLPPYADRRDFWTIDGNTTRWIGVALFAAGGALRIWPVYVLGHRFSGLVAIQPGHKLVTSGVYSIIRNPSYLGLLINSLGWGLAFRSVIGVVLTLLTIPPLVARIRSEENMLRSEFGDEYVGYCTHTWRLMPGVY